jgi:histidinol-phosphate phosphatase family protein
MKEHKPFLPSKDVLLEYTLFLDRDGVLNLPIVDDYARKADDLILVEDIVHTMSSLAVFFKRIILVTNQQGVGREVMSEIDLENVHLKMYNALKIVNQQWFDVAFFAPYLKTENHTWRKPSNGMLLKAKEYFSDIDFSKAMMIGDSPGDMKLADTLGLLKVKIENPQFAFDNQDFTFATLASFVSHLSKD